MCGLTRTLVGRGVSDPWLILPGVCIRTQGCGAIGSAAVSKTAGCRFESCRPCSRRNWNGVRRTGVVARPPGSVARDQPPRDTEEGEVAQSKRRRGRDAVDEDLDEVVDPVEDDDDLAEEDDEDEPVASRRRGGTATKGKRPGSGTDGEGTAVAAGDRGGMIGRGLWVLREAAAG